MEMEKKKPCVISVNYLLTVEVTALIASACRGKTITCKIRPRPKFTLIQTERLKVQCCSKVTSSLREDFRAEAINQGLFLLC